MTALADDEKTYCPVTRFPATEGPPRKIDAQVPGHAPSHEVPLDMALGGYHHTGLALDGAIVSNSPLGRTSADRGEAGRGHTAGLNVPDAARIVAGRYAIGEPVGRGGMGRVYRAHDRLLDRDVALKLLYADAVRDGELGRACATEARAAGRLAHEGIARVFDAGIDDGCLFIVMELVEGETLVNRLVNGARLSMREAVALVAQVADALDHAHACGVVHCDVKPANILVTPYGRTKLVDFGIAHAATVTGTLWLGELRGSAPYISPEQVRGDAVDGRSDVYALGAVLYELLAGRPAFDGVNVAAVMAQRLVTDPPSPRTLNPAVPASLDRVVRGALARDPEQRYQTAADLAADLWSVLPSLPERDEPPPSIAVRARRAADCAGAWLGGRACAMSRGLDRAGAALHTRTSGERLVALEPAIVQRASRACSAVARGRTGRVGAAIGDGVGARLAAVLLTLDQAGSGLHARPPRARLATGRATLRARARTTHASFQLRARTTRASLAGHARAARVRAMTWATIAAVAFARAAAQARVASVRAGLAARVAILVSFAVLANWASMGGRHARRLGNASGREAWRLGRMGGRQARRLSHASLTRAGAMLVASVAAASRGLDWVGAELQSRPPRARLAAGRAALIGRTGAVGTRTASWLVAAANAIDQAEPVARAACARAHVAMCGRSPIGPRGLGWPALISRSEGWSAVRGPLARRFVTEPAIEAAPIDVRPTLEELEAELASAFPPLDDLDEPSGAADHPVAWSETPTLTRSRGR